MKIIIFIYALHLCDNDVAKNQPKTKTHKQIPKTTKAIQTKTNWKNLKNLAIVYK